MVKKTDTKKSKEIKKPNKKELAELENRYKALFMDVVNVIKDEKNVAVVYQVLIDITMQIEGQIKSQCGPECDSGSCSGCK